jgi:MinD superfamily P-loop ATPase
MLSGILCSNKAINMNPDSTGTIMRTFVEMRKIIYCQNHFKEQMKEIKERLGEHDAQLSQIYDVLIAIGR